MRPGDNRGGVSRGSRVGDNRGGVNRSNATRTEKRASSYEAQRVESISLTVDSAVYMKAFEDGLREGLTTVAQGLLQESFQATIAAAIIDSVRVRADNGRIVVTAAGFNSGQLSYIRGRLNGQVKRVVIKAHEEARAAVEADLIRRQREAGNA